MHPRDYQSRSITQLYEWFESNPEGNPVLCMPGGSGKSVVIASIVKDALHSWPETRVLMLVHARELISQNYAKLRQLWPGAPAGIYSASLKRKQMGQPILYAGIQSVHRRAKEIGHIDLCLVDEAHAISNTENGTYRKLLAELTAINPGMRVVGFTATEYRMGHGLLTEGDDALFDDILKPVTIEELLHKGHLMPLRSKPTKHKLESKRLHKRGGEFISGEMQAKFNTSDNNTHVISELIERAADYRHWLIFCSGVEHSETIAAMLNAIGIPAASLTGEDKDRDAKIKGFESGQYRAMCNFGILTTGYDFPDLDCIVFLRAVGSPGLYTQMAVRGMRLKSHTDHCLVLDFAGVVETHGPITAVVPPRKAGSGNGEAPVKLCDNCQELCAISVAVCPACGHEFPPPKEKAFALRHDDIMGIEGTDMEITQWHWRKHISKTSGKEMLSCTYYGGLSDRPITCYHSIMHDGYSGQKARSELARIANDAGAELDYSCADLEDLAAMMNKAPPPEMIEYKKDGKFFNIVKRKWREYA